VCAGAWCPWRGDEYNYESNPNPNGGGAMLPKEVLKVKGEEKGDSVVLGGGERTRRRREGGEDDEIVVSGNSPYKV
jgi:hypothetical protein